MTTQDDNKNYHKSVMDRLLDAAEVLFCEKGFQGTSIRDIAASAGCNIASVNYYFGGKNNLYTEVWRRHLIPMRDVRIASIQRVVSQSQNGIQLEQLLRSFAETFVGIHVSSNSMSRLSRLMAREWIESHLPISIFVDEVIKPTMDIMSKALIETCPNLDQSKITKVIFSVVGQLVHLVHTTAIFSQRRNNLDLPVLDTQEMIDHIVKFSAAAIKAYNEGKIK